MIEIDGMSDKSYPKIKNLQKNAYYSGLLQNLYAGSEGEMAVFLQYRYQAYCLAKFNEKLSKTLIELSNSELKHQELLASAILMVGGDPIFSNNQGRWFSGRQIDYIKDTKQIILTNIELEEKSVIDYKLAISKIENGEIKLLLQSILLDEETHLLVLKKILKTL